MIEAPPRPARDPLQGPAPTAPWKAGTPRTLSPEDLQAWQGRIERGRTKCQLFHDQMDRGLAQYATAKVSKPVDGDETDPRIDYRHVESKKAQLYHRTPDVLLLPIDPQLQGLPGPLLPIRQKVLNYEIGPKAANAKRALHKTLVETLASSGWLITKLGFEQATLPDPMTGANVPIWSRRFISAVSAKKLVLPDDFIDSSDYDAAPWIAIEGVMPVAQARRAKWAIPEDFTGTTQQDTHVYQHATVEAAPSEASIEYTEVWLQAWLYDPAVFNPELYRCLILVKGLDEPAWYVDSPYQDLSPQGMLTDDSMRGNPIHVGTLRDLPDSAHVPADLLVVEQLSLELKKFRTSLTRGRRGRRQITLIDEKAGQPLIEKVTRNEGPIPVPGEYLDAGGAQRLIAVASPGTEPRDNYTAQDYIERDYEQAVGMSANQSGSFTKGKRTATEIRTVQGSSSARAETEKDRIREYVLALFRKFDAIVQRTMTVQELTKILGQQGAALWEQWRQLPGTYAYDILPDSGRYVDAKEHLTFVLDTYNLLRKDARVNTEELLALVARALNRDEATFIQPAKDETTDPPSASIAFKGDDTANPAMANLLLDICVNGGLKLRPETIAGFKEQHLMQQAAAQLGLVGARQPGDHMGSADRTEPINQHISDKTGGVQGVVQ